MMPNGGANAILKLLNGETDMMGLKDIERVLKGCANHRRVGIMRLLRQEPNLTLEQIAEHLNIDFRVASEHLRRLAYGGLIRKHYEGRYVHHELTERASAILAFLKKLE